MSKNPDYRELTVDDARNIKRILNGDNWLDAHVETNVREIVRALRANGINTVASCHHCAGLGDTKYMSIDCLSNNVTITVNIINQIFACLNIKDYVVDAHWYTVNNFHSAEAMVSIKIAKGSQHGK